MAAVSFVSLYYMVCYWEKAVLTSESEVYFEHLMTLFLLFIRKLS